jgi:UDP-glucuronate 4-epimerase
MTYADIHDLVRDADFRPATCIEDGIQRFVAWYRDYHGAQRVNPAS